MVLNRRVDRLLIVHAIADEVIDFPIDLGHNSAGT
jgi:hypothetical protein